MITCAINDPKIIRLLYADINAALNATPNGQEFDHMAYMKNLFADLAKNTSPEVAGKYLQSVPRLLIDASNTFFEDTDVNLGALKTLRNDFKKTDAIKSIIDLFGDKQNLEVLQAEISQNELLKSQLIEIPTAPEAKVVESQRFKTLGGFSGTMQNFIKVKPSTKVNEERKTITVEQINPEKLYMIKTFEGIKEAQGLGNVVDGVVYQGVKLYFNPQSLAQFAIGENYNKLDTETKAEIALSKAISNKNKKADPNIAQINQRVILVLSDQFGNPVYANDNGDLVSESEGGKLVYQFMRVARKNGSAYTVKDIYNTADSLLSPEEYAKMTYDSSIHGTMEEYVKQVTKQQQEEIKELYDLQENILSDLYYLLQVYQQEFHQN